MWTVPQALALLTLFAYAVVALLAVVGLWHFLARTESSLPLSPSARLWAHVQDSALGLAWIVSLVATLGSLYLSEVSHFPPCTLCWLQRIAMYPLVIVLGVGALRDDRAVRWYALPLAGHRRGSCLLPCAGATSAQPAAGDKLQRGRSLQRHVGARVRFDFYTRNGAGRFLAHCRIAAGCLAGCYARESGRQIGNGQTLTVNCS